jgi:hypothetical protein
MLDAPCSCRKVELRFHERSKRERNGYVHSRKYCGPDRRVNSARGGFFRADARDQRSPY